MFFYNSTLLMEGEALAVIIAFVTATGGIFLLACAVQGWFIGSIANRSVRLLLVAAALFMISGGLTTDLIGLGLTAGSFLLHRVTRPAAIQN